EADTLAASRVFAGPADPGFTEAKAGAAGGAAVVLTSPAGASAKRRSDRRRRRVQPSVFRPLRGFFLSPLPPLSRCQDRRMDSGRARAAQRRRSSLVAK